MGTWPSSRGPKNLCRLAMRGPDNITVLAETDAGIVGLVHLVLDDDERWGSLVDNLHVTHAHRRHGIGSALIARVAQAVIDGGTTGATYLWVLEQNTAAQSFCAAHRGRSAERAFAQSPGGLPGRLKWPPGETPVYLAPDWPVLYRSPEEPQAALFEGASEFRSARHPSSKKGSATLPNDAGVAQLAEQLFCKQVGCP
ncbi:MAG: GNAT family N-acetyltransferase [Candidatus Dormiibacterota bacterium]